MKLICQARSFLTYCIGLHEARDTEALIEGAATLQHIAVTGHGGGHSAMGQVKTEDD